MSIIIYSINVSGSKGLKYTFYNKSIAKSKPLNDLLRGNIRIKIEANKWSAERNKMHTKLYHNARHWIRCKQTKVHCASKNILCLRFKPFVIFLRLKSNTHLHILCLTSKKKKKERKKLSDKALYISPNYWFRSYSKV